MLKPQCPEISVSLLLSNWERKTFWANKSVCQTIRVKVDSVSSSALMSLVTHLQTSILISSCSHVRTHAGYCLMLQPDSPLYIIFLIKAEASRSSALPQCVWRCVSVCLSSRTNIVPERMWASLLFGKSRNQFWCCATSVSEYKITLHDFTKMVLLFDGQHEQPWGAPH